MRLHDPPRLRRDGTAPPLLRVALGAEGDEPSVSDLARLAVGLGIPPMPPAGGAPPGTPATAAPATSGALALLKSKVISGVVAPALIGAMSATAVLKVAAPSRSTPVPSASIAVPLVVSSRPASVPAAPKVSSPSPSASAVPIVVPDAPRASSSAKERREPVPAEVALPAEPFASSPPPPPESEVRLLERAKASLDSDPAAALALTDQHRDRFPRGMLEQEAEVIAVEALARAGRYDLAAARLAKFRARFRNSAYLPHLESVVRRPK
jgi:hypothetical protein